MSASSPSLIESACLDFALLCLAVLFFPTPEQCTIFPAPPIPVLSRAMPVSAQHCPHTFLPPPHHHLCTGPSPAGHASARQRRCHRPGADQVRTRPHPLHPLPRHHRGARGVGLPLPACRRPRRHRRPRDGAGPLHGGRGKLGLGAAEGAERSRRSRRSRRQRGGRWSRRRLPSRCGYRTEHRRDGLPTGVQRAASEYPHTSCTRVV